MPHGVELVAKAVVDDPPHLGYAQFGDGKIA